MPYWEDLYKQLSKMTDLEVIYLRRGTSQHPLKDPIMSGYKATLLSESWTYVRLIRRAFTERESIWIIPGWNSVAYMALYFLLWLLKRSTYVFTDAPLQQGRSSKRIVRVARHWILKFLFSTATGFLGTGQLARSTLVRMGADASKTHNLPYPLDESRYLPIAARIPEPPPLRTIRIIFVGRISRADKRIDLLIDAFAEARKQCGDRVDLQLLVAGSGPDEPLLLDLIARHNVSSSVRMLGWLDQQGLCSAYSEADVYFHSADFEPYGVTLVEALFSGLYIIASNCVGAAAELIDDPQNGRIFRAGDTTAAASVIIETVDMFLKARPSRIDIAISGERWYLGKYIETLNGIITFKTDPVR